MFEIITKSPEETFQFGDKIGSKLVPGDVLCLTGELGSGKTNLIQGIAAGVRVSDIVRSPSFNIIHEHLGASCKFFHIDLYRINKKDELFDLGIEEYLYSNNICVIEWANRAPELWPLSHLGIHLEILGEQERKIIFKPSGEKWGEFLHDLFVFETPDLRLKT